MRLCDQCDQRIELEDKDASAVLPTGDVVHNGCLEEAIRAYFKAADVQVTRTAQRMRELAALILR